MWFSLLLGHIAGDYIIQNDWMAKGKSTPGARGNLICWLHCSVYALCVAVAFILGGWRCGGWHESFGVALTVAYLSHWPIDRFSLGKRWMHFFGQTTEGPFAPIVYVGVDNGAHLILMWAVFSWLAI